MPTAKERLSHLLILAGEGPTQRAALLGELADLVLDWPQDYPEAMRPPVLALLEKTVREADDDTRTKLAARLGGHSELPLHLVNEFYLSAPARVRREILTRNQFAHDETDDDIVAVDARALLAATRDAALRDFAATFGGSIGIPRQIAQSILSDSSGEPLAVLCKGAQLDRATFSTLVLLKSKAGETQLSVFDSVPQHAAERLTRHWRTLAEHHPAERAHAAE